MAINNDQLKKFKEALADIIVSSQGLCTYDACKDVAEREATFLISMLLPEPNTQSSNIKDRIHAEIERLKDKISIGLSEYDMGYENGKGEICNDLLAFIDSLPEQPKFKRMNIPSGGGAMGTTPPKFKLDVKPEQPVEGLDVTDFCKPIDPGIAQCIADHWWEMIGEESTNKKPVEGLEEAACEYVEELEKKMKAETGSDFDEDVAYLLTRLFIAGAEWQKEG